MKAIKNNIAKALVYRILIPVFAFLFLTSLNQAAAANAEASKAGARSPAATISQFYRWYFHELSLDHAPYTDNPAKIRSYVADALVTEVLNGAGKGADYFTKSQGYYKDWLPHFSVTEVSIDQATAVEKLTMGNTEKSTVHLLITLIKDGNAWEIRKVEGTDGTETSMTR